MFQKLKIGKKIKKGEWIGKIGNSNENGKWLPHLHFQIILDLLGHDKNFPGVGEEFLFNIWNKISPDPNLILRIPKSFYSNNNNFKDTLKKRRKNISDNLSISYKKHNPNFIFFSFKSPFFSFFHKPSFKIQH